MTIKTFNPDFSNGFNWHFEMSGDTRLEFPLNIHECRGYFMITQDAVGGRKLEISEKYSMLVDKVEIKDEPHSESLLHFVCDGKSVVIVGYETWEKSDAVFSPDVIVHH